MKIVLTGSISNIGKPLTKQLVKNGHEVTVISSKAERQKDIEALGAVAAIGTMQDTIFLTETFAKADIVYLMETMDAAGGDMSGKDIDFIGAINVIGQNYKQAIEQSGVKRIVHLSSVGAHMEKGNGILIFHHDVENILKQLPQDVSIKTIRAVGFYTNMLSFIHNIKSKGVIISNYGGDNKEPWVSPLDVAEAIVQAIETPFEGQTMRYVASDEFSPNEAAKILGKSIGKPDLEWTVIPDEQLLETWIGLGFNPQIAHGFIETQSSQRSGQLYQDYNRNKPELGKVKLEDFARDFSVAYQHES